jgi:magnesium transporter
MDSSRGRQPLGPGSTSDNTPHPPSSSGHPPRRRKNHRGGKKKKSRRKSFGIAPDEIAHDSINSAEGLDESPQGFYTRPGRNLSTTSLESEALLDHR